MVLISMTTSGQEEIPRNIEFLFSRNRLNVATSRARCLSVLVVSPKLLHVKCMRMDQLTLINVLCWAEEYARIGARGPRA